jgi:PAS domain S-box-containing protein
MVKLGNFLFKYRNLLFPLLFFSLVFSVNPYLGRTHFEYVSYVIGIVVALAGQTMRALTIGFAYIKRGGKNKKIYAEGLVTEGIFAHSRNPLYLGNILIIIGLGIVAHSVLFALIGIPLFIFFYMSIIKAEENFLAKKFGQEYVEYSQNVNRFIPKFSGIAKTFQSMTFNWKRLVAKEYGSAYLWVVCMIVLIERNQYVRYGNQGNRTVIVILVLSFILMTNLYAIARYFKKSNLAESEERLQRLFATSKEGLLLLDSQTGNVVKANAVIEELLGYSNHEIVGKKMKDIGLLKDIEDVQEMIHELYKLGFLHYSDILVENKRGEKIYTEIYLIGRTQVIQCNVRDITERKRAEEEIKKKVKELKEETNNLKQELEKYQK